MEKIIVSTIVVGLLLLSGIQSLAAGQGKNKDDGGIYFDSYRALYKIEKQPDDIILDKGLLSNAINDGNGSIIWSYEDIDCNYGDFSICDNGNYGIAGITISDHVSFQLFKTLGNGTPKWTFSAPQNSYWSQVDASKEAGTIVGLAVSDFSTPPEDSIKRLYRWDLINEEPCWFFDIPDGLHVFNGGFTEDNIAVSDNGEKIILGVSDFQNQIMKIFIFNYDSNVPILTFPITFDYPYVRFNLLDVSYDGSIVLVANDREAIIIDTTLPAIRWRGDPDGISGSDDISIAAISGDGSVLIGKYYANGHCLKAFKWNETDYEELWGQNFVPPGWFIFMNLHTLEVSDDGSTVMVGVYSMGGLETKLFTYDVNSGALLWENHTIVEGEYPIYIMDICLSKDGSKGIVAHADDEFGVNPEVKVYNRESSTPFFTIDAPATALSVDISPDGTLAVAGGDLFPSWFITSGMALFGIDLGFNNVRPETPTITGPTSGTAGVEYKYTFTTIDPDGDDVYYFVDWDDGETEEWIGPYSSGEEVTISHIWSEQGTYTISSKAKDTYYAESDWATLPVTMPLNQISTKSVAVMKSIQTMFSSTTNGISLLR